MLVWLHELHIEINEHTTLHKYWVWHLVAIVIRNEKYKLDLLMNYYINMIGDCICIICTGIEAQVCFEESYEYEINKIFSRRNNIRTKNQTFLIMDNSCCNNYCHSSSLIPCFQLFVYNVASVKYNFKELAL